MHATWRTNRRGLIGGVMGVVAGARFGVAHGAAWQGSEESCLAIENVTLLSLASGAVPQAGMSVVISGERIAAIAPTAATTRPEGCAVVDGRGKWLLPGLADMHIHFLSFPIPELPITPEQMLTPYLANGVLQALDMAASPESNIIRDAIATGEYPAPFLATAAMIDGVPAMRPGAREIATPEEAEGVVRQLAAEGFDFVKVYSRLDVPVFVAVLAAAEEAGMRVIGHLPGMRKHAVEEVLLPGFAMIAHAEELSFLAKDKSDAEIANFVELMQENNTAITSTLYLDEQILAQTIDPAILAETEGLPYVHPVELMLWFEQNSYRDLKSPERIAMLEALTEFNLRLVGELAKAGVPVLAGTDASFIPGLAPGFALHHELAALVRAGLSPRQALEAATVVPADWLGVLEDRGTVEAGKRANLLLLDADPLADIRNTRQIAAVVIDGQLFDRQQLDLKLANLDQVYAPFRPAISPAGEAAVAAQQGLPALSE